MRIHVDGDVSSGVYLINLTDQLPLKYDVSCEEHSSCIHVNLSTLSDTNLTFFPRTRSRDLIWVSLKLSTKVPDPNQRTRGPEPFDYLSVKQKVLTDLW